MSWGERSDCKVFKKFRLEEILERQWSRKKRYVKELKQ